MVELFICRKKQKYVDGQVIRQFVVFYQFEHLAFFLLVVLNWVDLLKHSVNVLDRKREKYRSNGDPDNIEEIIVIGF